MDIHTMEHSTIYQNRIVRHTTRMSLKDIVVSERTWYPKVTAD